MREGWTYKKLGDIIVPAKVIKNRSGKDLPILSITMHHGIVSQKDRFKKVIASVDTTEYKIVRKGQLVIAFPIDEGLLYTQDIVEEGIMSPAYSIWDVNYSCITRSFLVRYLHSPFAFSYYRSKLRGTTMRRRNIPREDLLSMPLPLPSISQQEAIVSELDEITSLLALKREQLQTYDKLAQSLFYEMFGDPVENEKGWEVKRLSEITTKIGSGATPKGGNESYKKEGISLIRSMNVRNNTFVYEDLAHIDEAQAKALSNVDVCANDVLLNITGASVARCCMVPNGILPARVNQHVCIIRSNNCDVIPIYLNRLLTNDNYQLSLLYLSKSKAATREALPKSIVDNLQIPLPPLSLQQQFASRIEQIELQKQQVQAAIEKLETLLASRMQYWFE